MKARTHRQLVGFIWGICNLLRGPYKRNEYREVILPLTVLRRFDCMLASARQAVLAATEQTEEPIAAGRPFYHTSELDLRRLDDPNNLASKERCRREPLEADA